MKSSVVVITLLLAAATASAAHIDMNDPRRSLGREDDIRVDAQLLQDTLSANCVLSITYQIENLSAAQVAIADRTIDVSFNSDDATVTVSIGAEIPTSTVLPHLVVIAPGEKKTFRTGGALHGVQTSSGPWAVVPRYVQFRVNVLRDIGPFLDAITKQHQSPAVAVTVTDDMFNHWLDGNDSILLNALPVKWSAAPPRGTISAEQGSPSGGMW